MSIRIPLSSPDITEAEVEAVTAVLRTNSLSLGPKLVEFEYALAASHQMPHAMAVSSGTAALHLAIRALNLGIGDEVIVPSFTFVAVANAVLYERAIPVFADIDPVTLNIDPVSVEAAITPRTRAMIIVHTFGVPAEMDELVATARRHNLAVIEDACEAIGATYKGKPVGSFGDLSVFAFYPNKQITTGEGGALLCRDSRLAERIRALRNQGRYASSEWLQHIELGYNYRLSEMACALGLIQLSRLNEILSKRARVAEIYDIALREVTGIHCPSLRLPDRTISWFVYVVRLDDALPEHARDLILDALQKLGIGCGRYFAPIHRQPAFSNALTARDAKLPWTESIAKRTLALPFFNRIRNEQIAEVAGALTSAIARIDQSCL
jgi:perosamine synthetase